MDHNIDPCSLFPINQRRQRTTYSPDADRNEIIGWRNTSRRTSWRNRHLSLDVNSQRELRLLRKWHKNLIDLLPIATNHCYTLFLTLFLISKKILIFDLSFRMVEYQWLFLYYLRQSLDQFLKKSMMFAPISYKGLQFFDTSYLVR